MRYSGSKTFSNWSSGIPGAPVADANHGLVALLRGGHARVAAVFHGVVDEIGKAALQGDRNGQYGHARLAIECDILAGIDSVGTNAREQRIQVDALHPAATAYTRGKVQPLLDHALHRAQVCDQFVAQALVSHLFQPQTQPRNRRLQVVCNRRQHLRSFRDVALKARLHPVERCRRVADFGRTLFGQWRLIDIAAERGSRPRETPQGTCRHACDDVREQNQAKRQDDHEQQPARRVRPRPIEVGLRAQDQP